MTTAHRARRAFWPTFACLLGAVLSGCAARSAAPTRRPDPALSADKPVSLPAAPPSANGANADPSWTLEEEQAGAITDGVSLVDVRVEVSDGVQRFVFDFDGEGPPPHAKLERADSPGKLWLTLSGVRSAPRSLVLLTGEGGRVLGEPTATGSTPITGYGRVFYPDDSAIRLELRSGADRPHRLLPSAQPRRLILEFQR